VVSGASVYQNYHIKQISIPLVDVKFTHLNFKQQGTTLKTSKPVKSSTASNSRVTNIKLAKGNHQFKTLCQNKRLPVAMVKVCDAAKSTSKNLKVSFVDCLPFHFKSTGKSSLGRLTNFVFSISRRDWMLIC